MAGTGKIAELVKRLEVMASPAWRESLSRQLAEQALQLVDDGFKNETDPYGNRWAPTQQPNQILQKTGDLRRGWGILAVTQNGFRIGDSVDYGIYQQRKRKMVPTSDRGLPDKWQREFDKVSIRFMKETMGGRS